jgi:hypothetical protein
MPRHMARACMYAQPMRHPTAFGRDRLSENESPGLSTARPSDYWDEDGWDYEADSHEWTGERGRAHGPERDFRLQSWVPNTRAFGARPSPRQQQIASRAFTRTLPRSPPQAPRSTPSLNPRSAA